MPGTWCDAEHISPSLFSPKAGPLDCGIAITPPSSPHFGPDEATFLSAHYFGAFCVLQVPEDVRVLEPKLWALVQLCVSIWAFEGDLLPRTVLSSRFSFSPIP